MSLPDSRDYTAIDGVTQFPAVTDQRIQDNIVNLWKAKRGRDFLQEDDFTGDLLDRGKWIDDSAVAIAVDDSVAGGMGAAYITIGSGAAGVLSRPINLGSRDFRFGAMVRITSIGTGTSNIVVGFTDNSNTYLAFTAVVGTAFWKIVGTGMSPFTTSVAYGSTYQFLEIWRTSGNVQFYIDGVLVKDYAGDPVSPLSTYDSMPAFGWSARRNTGTVTTYLDKVALWAVR